MAADRVIFFNLNPGFGFGKMSEQKRQSRTRVKKDLHAVRQAELRSPPPPLLCDCNNVLLLSRVAPASVQTVLMHKRSAEKYEAETLTIFDHNMDFSSDTLVQVK